MTDPLQGFGPPEPDLFGFSAPEPAPAAQVRPGEAPPVQTEPAAQRRLLMAVPQPDQPDNLGVFPVPKGPVALAGQGPQAARPGAYTLGGPDMAAFQAAHGDLDPEKATQALVAAGRTGFSPQFAADTLPEVQAGLDQQDTAAKLSRAPALASYAARGHVEASAVKDSLDDLSFLEWAITGRWEMAPVAADIPYMVAPKLATPPFWWAALKEALAGQEYAKLATEKATVGISPKDAQRLADLRAQQGESGSLGAHNFATKALVGTVRALPSLVAIGGPVAAGGALAGPPGAVAGGLVGLFGQSFGPLYDRLTQLQKEDGAPLLSDQEARTIAFLGAYGTSVASQVVGMPFLQKLPGVREILGRVTGEGVAAALARPGVAKLITSFGKNYAAGIAMMMVQAAGTAATEEAAKATHGRPADLGRVGAVAADAALQAAQDLPLISAYHPIVETVGAIARAHAEGAQLSGMVDAATKAPLVTREPGIAAEVIRQAAGQPGAADTAYVSKEVWDKHWRAQGQDPAEVAALVMGDRGRGYAEADATGGHLAVPIEKYVTDLLPEADKLAPDTALSADGLTPNEAKEAAGNLGGPGEPMPGPVAEPTRGESASYKDAARSLLEEKAIGDIRPAYYDAAVLRAGKEAINVATERDKVGEKIVAEYAKALDTTEELARDAIAGARKGFYGAGMQEASGGELGTGALREAGRDVATAERRLGKRSAEAEAKLASLEAQHGANEAGRKAEVDMLTRQQQLSAEAAKMARDLRAEMDKLQAGLSRVDRDALASGSPGYVGAYDAVMGALDGQAAAGALAPALDAMKAQGARVRFDEAAVADLLANPRPWKELTPPEARNLSDFVSNIRAAAARTNEIAIADRRAGLREVAGQIAAEVSAMPSKTNLMKQSGVPMSTLEKAQLTANAWNGVLLRPKTNLSFMGETAKAATFDRIIEARNLRDRLMRETGEFYRKNVSELSGELRQIASREVKVGGFLPTLPGTDKLDVVPRAFLWKLHLEMSSEGNMDRVLGGNRWDQTTVERMLYHDPETRLGRTELDFLQTILDHNNEHVWPLLKAKQERLDGVAPPKVDAIARTVYFEDGTSKTYEGGYHPLSRDTRFGIAPAGSVSPAGFKSVEDFFGPNYQRAETFKPFANERAEHASYVVDLDWDTITSHMTQALHDIAFDEPIRDVGRLVLDPEFQRAAVSALGPEKAAQIPAWLRSVATQNADSTPQNLAIVGRAFGLLRRRMITSLVGDSIPLATLQSSHVPFVLIKGEIGGIHGVPALFSVFKPFTLGDDGARAFPTWRDSYAESTELQHRDLRNTRRVIEDMNQLPKPSTMLGRGLEGWRGFSGIFMHAMDRYLSTWIYVATKNEALAKGMPRDEAIDYANGKVQDLLPTHDIETAPPLLTSRNIGALLIMHGFQSTVYNLRQQGIREASLDFHNADSPQEYAKAGLGATWRIARWTAALAALGIGEAAGFHGPRKDEGEDWPEWLARRALAAQGMDIPWIGPVLDPLASLFVSKAMTGEFRVRPISVRQAPTLALVQKGADLVGEFASGKTDDEKLFFDGAETALVACGVPSAQTRTVAQYMYDLVQGNAQPRGPFDVASGFLGRRPSKHPESNPLTAIQDVLSGD